MTKAQQALLAGNEKMQPDLSRLVFKLFGAVWKKSLRVQPGVI